MTEDETITTNQAEAIAQRLDKRALGHGAVGYLKDQHDDIAEAAKIIRAIARDRDRWKASNLESVRVMQHMKERAEQANQRVAELEAVLSDHGPDGHNVTNAQWTTLLHDRDELEIALEKTIHEKCSSCDNEIRAMNVCVDCWWKHEKQEYETYLATLPCPGDCEEGYKDVVGDGVWNICLRCSGKGTALAAFKSSKIVG